MMQLSKEPVTIYRKDYQPSEFQVDNIHLNFKILHPEEVIVVNTVQVERVLKGADTPLFLYGEAIELIEVLLEGVSLTENEYAVSEEGLTLFHVPDKFELVITTKLNPKANTLLSGLYYADGIFCTQCEASGFRRITYFLDRPDILTHFTVRIEADRQQYPVLLSNGNCIAQDENSVTWTDPFKKPAYLFALVVGDLAMVEDQFVTSSGRKVVLRIYVDHGNEDKCDHAMESLKRAMRWEEQNYEREYDLDIYMIVAVRSFNMGAMENKGLNIFNAKYVLGRPESATDVDYAGIEKVIGHEYFHNWTGNRVTCRDWFQLSLKEGLTVFRDQEFARDMQESSVCRIHDVKTLRTHQFSEDASPMAHPVRPDSYIEVNNFYTATVYNKGGEVIRMQQVLLGKAGFRKGMDLYFERYDGQAVTIDDFVKAMEDANGRDLTQFKRWYSQAGTPVLTVQSKYDEETKQFHLTIQQSCPPTPGQPIKEPLHIPVRIALWDEQGGAIAIPEAVLELKEPEQTWVWQDVPKPIVSLLGDFSAPVKLNMHYSDAELRVLIRAETNDFSRWEAMQRLLYKHLFEKNTVVISVMKDILDHDKIDWLSKAELLTLPGFLECSQWMGRCDVEGIESGREYWQKTIGQRLAEDFLVTYETLNAKSSSEMTARAYGERRLKNMCLMYLVYGQHPEAKKLAYEQLVRAKNMTDEIAALTGLMHFDEDMLERAANQFYRKWGKNDLVLDKWFATQAISPLPSALNRIKKLINHPHFDCNNPNKIKALLGTFWMYNPRGFHNIDGSGYDFFVEQILAFDKNNAFVSASLARSLINWKLFDEKRQFLMKNALIRILEEKPISKDLYEVVSKSVD